MACFALKMENILIKLTSIDGDVSKIVDYLPDINIIVDKSIIKKDRNFVSHLPNDYILVDTFLETYILRENSPLQLIIEKTSDNNIKNFYFTFGAKFKGYSNADIINFSIKMKTFNHLLICLNFDFYFFTYYMLSILKAMFISIVFIIIIHYFYNYLLNQITKPIQINVYDELDHKYNKMYSTIYKNDKNDKNNNNNNNNEHEHE